MRRLLDMAEEKILNMLNDAAQLALKAVDLAIAVYKGEGKARDVRELASTIHQIHDEVVELAMEAIARFNPVATDLRLLRTAMEAAYDLYRIARYAYDVAETAEALGVKCPTERVEKTTQVVKEMTQKAVGMILRRDPAPLQEVRKLDDEVVDREYREALAAAIQNPTPCAVVETLALRFLERASDHAVYMAEKAHYLATGQAAP